jgi:single-strand DNA-binding protein
MTEVQVTVLGTVCSEVRFSTAGDSGIPVARFQIRSLPRRYDRRSGTWSDGEPSYYSVTCWRRLAEHAASSLGVGDPVLATGRLKISRWKRNEETMVSAELDAQSVGHDLRWGTSAYRRGLTSPPARIPGPRRSAADADPPAGGEETMAASAAEPGESAPSDGSAVDVPELEAVVPSAA